MPVFTRPDAEIRYEAHGSGHPLLLFAPGGLVGRCRTLLLLQPGTTDFLTRHIPAP